VLSTELRTADGCHEFVIRTDEPDYLAELTQLGYGALGDEDDAFLRRFPLCVDADAIFENFTRCIGALLDQVSRRTRTPWEDALEHVCDRAERAGIEWFLVGSASVAARGIDVIPGDIDFVVSDQNDALAAFGDVLINPVLFHPDKTFVSSWSGRAFEDARLEWISFVHPRLDSWMWPNEVGHYAVSHLETIRWRQRSIRVSPLELHLEIAKQRGFTDRVAAIRGRA
jgi:hypothetical protein